MPAKQLKFLFIADLHLAEFNPRTAEMFLKFLSTQARHINGLYILGDLFEAWVGDDDLTKFNRQIIHALKQITQSGVPIYIMKGNRDFLLGRRFVKMTGCRRLKDPSVISLGKSNIVLSHGDLLCTQDKKYQLFRKVFQNHFLQRVFLTLPLSWRKNFASQVRRFSKFYHRNIKNKFKLIPEETVKNIMEKYHATHLIHGHLHQRGMHDVNLAGRQGKRMILGDWNETGSALCCTVENDQLKWNVIFFAP